MEPYALEEQEEIVIVSPHVRVLPKCSKIRSQRARLESAKPTVKAFSAVPVSSLAAILQRKEQKLQRLALSHWKTSSKAPHITLREVKTMSSAPRKYFHFRGEMTYIRGNFANFAKKIELFQAIITRKDAKRLARRFANWQSSLYTRRAVTSPTSDRGGLRLRPVVTHSGTQTVPKTFNWQQAEQHSMLEVRPVSSLSKSFWRPAGVEKRITLLSPRSRTTLPSPSGADSFVLSPRALPLYSSPYLPESYATLQFLARP